ncbi:hypothetical protein [Fredinandcohnia onubensis]|uniref:hypothetical protein n=1 Tax=Fredinandcohnia onubensis TaxID=1571209 RepID=UPI000C0BE088|nr:hypothetical protein [Fredinandcohnia onubensis]
MRNMNTLSAYESEMIYAAYTESTDSGILVPALEDMIQSLGVHVTKTNEAFMTVIKPRVDIITDSLGVSFVQHRPLEDWHQLFYESRLFYSINQSYFQNVPFFEVW